jgi:hypothetical protein
MNINLFEDNLEENIVKIQYKDIKLFLIKKIFDDNSFKELQSEIINLMKDSNNWQSQPGQELKFQRKVLKFNVSKIIDDISNSFKDSELLSYINKIMNENYTSYSFRVWWDTADYFIGFHTDNDRIDTSMQIYVTDVIHNHLGTSFAYIDDGSKGNIPILTLPYTKNSGYLFKNTNEIRHGMTMSVPPGFDRISLYFYIN